MEDAIRDANHLTSKVLDQVIDPAYQTTTPSSAVPSKTAFRSQPGTGQPQEYRPQNGNANGHPHPDYESERLALDWEA